MFGWLSALAACNQLLGVDPPGRGRPAAADEAGAPISDSTLRHDSSSENQPLSSAEHPTTATATTADPTDTSQPTDSSTSAPGSCTTSECSNGDSLCELGAIQSCERDVQGCWVWSEAEPCATATCADETACREFEASNGSDAGSPPEPCGGSGCPVAVGEPCEDNDECAEGECRDAADGSRVCCTASCDGACKSCAPNGRSCVNDLDDAACGEVQCPADTPCRKYTASAVSAGRCRDGECGEPDTVCPFVARGEAKPCGEDLLCDDTGNCDVPKFAQGAACETASQCANGICANGVCCESDCDGLCMDCRPGTGKCDVLPADDAMCPPVDCYPRNNCSIWDGDLVSNLCVRLGACKSAQDCSFRHAEKGTLCQYGWLCDGEGECTEYPEVECGVTTCTVQDGSGDRLGCCIHSANPDVSTPECNPLSACAVSFDDWHLGCDEHGDCNIAEQVCCAIVVNSIGHTACTTITDCNNYYEHASASFVELCESPAMGALPCSTGQACSVTSNTLIGYKFCELPN